MTESKRPLRIAIVAGEVSGDILAAGLMREIRLRHPDVEFIGIAGPRMQELGIQTLFEMEELAVLGLVEVLARLPRLLAVRRQLIRELIANPPDLFIGVDAPDFNIGVELILKRQGIPTVHYVSPSVWAWRQSRIHKIKASVYMVLSLLPFEKEFYDKDSTPCTYVGHRLAREIPIDVPIMAARISLGFSNEALKSNQVVAIMPGSRTAEINFLTPEFAEAAYSLVKTFPVVRFICAATSKPKAELISKLWQKHAPNLPLIIWIGRAQDVMAASNAVIIASGTATLEAMLLNKRMVVCYIVSQITAAIGKKLLKVDSFSLPNLLCGKKIVPELIQYNCTPQNIRDEIVKIFTTENRQQIREFTKIHHEMSINSDDLAADAVMKVISDKYAQIQASLSSTEAK